MNDFSFEQMTVGMSAAFQAQVRDGSIEKFCEMSGDSNPLHCDQDYALARGYPGRVAHGMLTASLYSRLAGIYLPGKRALLHRVDSSFLKPVFEGDSLDVIGEVTAVNETVRQLEIKASIRRGQELVSRAKI